jgi:hypothetical protein
VWEKRIGLPKAVVSDVYSARSKRVGEYANDDCPNLIVVVVGEGVGEGEGDGEGSGEGEGVGDGEGDGEGSGVGEGVGDGEGVSEGEGEGEGDCECDGLGEGLGFFFAVKAVKENAEATLRKLRLDRLLNVISPLLRYWEGYEYTLKTLLSHYIRFTN